MCAAHYPPIRFHPCSSERFAELGCGERKVAGGAGKEAVCLGPPHAIAVQLADRGLDRKRQLGVGLNLPCHTLGLTTKALRFWLELNR